MTSSPQDAVASANGPSFPPKKLAPISLGRSPYPNHQHPTAEEATEVTNRLMKVHEPVIQPTKVPPPLKNVATCGEVPSVLDALVRTRISAATTFDKANATIAALVKTFGESESCSGTVNYEKVYQSSPDELERVLRIGGLAKIKTKDIKEMLDYCYQLVQNRIDPADPMSAERELLESLQYMFNLSKEEAYQELNKFPGVGVKTAACVMLFCLKQPTFAVDTHVFRIAKWLNWVPAKANEIKTFAHCDMRIPDHLKYPLHQLFITHGKNCHKCVAQTKPGSKEWNESCCVLEDLLTRTKSEHSRPTHRSSDAEAVASPVDAEAEASPPDAEVEEPLPSSSSDESDSDKIVMSQDPNQGIIKSEPGNPRKRSIAALAPVEEDDSDHADDADAFPPETDDSGDDDFSPTGKPAKRSKVAKGKAVATPATRKALPRKAKKESPKQIHRNPLYTDMRPFPGMPYKKDEDDKDDGVPGLLGAGNAVDAN
ncbi:DNA glycosylase [Trichodelitschia bisporula]|uniref:DNA glycosylase n=1 Tax=Trichodelitschia bisporula TaxID=703511 RepID=A0A6G1I8Q0_9PEZI|nr:DNA glycosylase [Trichodelitschia bisporula]